MARADRPLPPADDRERGTRDLRHALYQALFEASGSGIAVADVEGRLVEVNTAYADILGYSPDELRGFEFRSLVPPEDLERYLVQAERLVSGELPSFVIEHRLLAKDGRTVWVRSHASVIRADDGTPVLFVGTSEDITDRRYAEARLQRSQALLRIAGRKTRVGGWAVDAASREVFWSDEIFEILGADRDTAPTMDEGLEAYPEPHRSRLIDAVEACLQHGTPFDLEVEAVTGDGRRIDARVVAEAERDATGRVTEVLGAFQDISELRSAHARTAEVAQRLTNTLESMTDALFTLDAEWRFTYLNARAGELLLRDRDELIGRDIWEEFAPAVDTAIYHVYHRAVEEQIAVVVPEYYYPPLDTWFEVNAYPSDGGLAVYFRDITEQYHARVALEEREAKLAEQAALLDNARDAILVFDLDGTTTYWNQRAERLYGWTADDAIGRSVRDLLSSDAAAFDTATEVTLDSGEWVGELEQRTRDERAITVEARWTLVRDDAGAPRSILAIITDVTESKRLEAQFLRAQRMESLGTLAGGIAHDLNNVLAPVMMSIELLKLDESDERRLDLLRTIESSTERGADMIRQVLSFARGVEGSHQELLPKTLLADVERILRDTLPRNIELRVDAGDELWPVAGEATQLHQVLVNLAVNARDAMPDGGTLRFSADNIRLDESYAALTHGADPGTYVRILVEDDGIGIPAEVVDRIFEPFFTTKAHGEGTGLGLSTSLAIVASHGGFLRVYSEEGVGTTFKLYLPAVTADHHLATLEPAPHELPRGNGELVLVVDDEAAIRDITRQTLETFGYRVLEAGDGSAAVSLFLEHRGEIEVVLTDMMMPVMDGPSMIHALLELDPTVTIIGASGLNANGKVAKAAEAGVEHFLPKPYTAQTLLTTLRAAIGAQR